MNKALIIPFLIVGLTAWLIVSLSRHSAILKDQMIPQIPPRQQTYSLARTQMAFWFLIILLSFLYLFFTTWNYDTISTQALTLMGIAVVTAGGAAIVDRSQDTPEDALNDGLKALGLSNYQDVLNLYANIADASALGAALTPAGQAKLNDMLLLKQTYLNRTQPYLTQGLFTDLTTDVDGTALHRLQALVWTAVLGAIFIYEVLSTDKMMPDMNANLLALMGISNAGYVGFKYNETQY
jgi:hypothetical protein